LAQSSNGETTFLEETVSSGGGRVGGGHPLSAVTTLGQPVAGVGSNETFTIWIGYPADAPDLPPGTRGITVSGTLSEPVASVVVSTQPTNTTVPAVVSGATFQAVGVPMTEGANTLTATATDFVGRSGSADITVYLDTHPPARPTVSISLVVATDATYTLTGTKTSGTSIWINGVEVVPLDDATTWSATMPLVEGDNLFVIVTKDAAGNASTSVTVNLILDHLPPVISEVAFFDPQGAGLRLDGPTQLPKTNFSPVTVRGVVDDSLTRVEINGETDRLPQRPFEAAVSLRDGSNTLTLIATSPNQHVTTQTQTVIRGTIPTLTAFQPPEGTTLDAQTASTIAITATDDEHDPLEYQVLVEGAVLSDWGSPATRSWVPNLSQIGLQTLGVVVRDNYGGSNAEEREVFVVRPPVPPTP
jgi:hypothetical protein